MSDLRFALRQLLRNPTFALGAVATLALGIATNGVVFSVINAVLLRPLPFNEPDRLVEVSAEFAESGRVPLAIPEFFDLRDTPGPLRSVAFALPLSGNLTGVDVPERVEARAVSGNFFATLGIEPVLGRLIRAEDEGPGITELGVISYALWQRRFGGRPDVIGKTLRLDDDSYTVIGVLPEGFTHPGETPGDPVAFWYPAGFRAQPFPSPSRQQRGGLTIGRLAPAATLQQAQDQVSALARALGSRYPEAYRAESRWDFRVLPLHEVLVGNTRTPLLILVGAVTLVLLVACTNVAGLQLARSTSRTTELAIRLASGASRWRLARQLLIESAVLGSIGGAAGLLLMVAGIRLARASLAEMLPRSQDISADLRVVSATLVLIALATLLTGVVAVLMVRPGDLAGTLRQGGRGQSGGRGRTRARAGLVVFEIALTLVLLTGAGLLVRSLWLLGRVQPGFDPVNLLTLQMSISYPNDPSRGRYVDPAARSRYFQEVLARVAEIPGVGSAAATSALPFSGPGTTREVTIEGRLVQSSADVARAEWRSASSGYFGAMRIPLVGGRGITDQDDAGTPRVAVISRLLAQRFWPGQDPLGKRLKVGGAAAQAPWHEVVGVVGDVRSQGLDLEPRGQVYVSLRQAPPIVLSLVARTVVLPGTLAGQARTAIRSVETDQPVFSVRSMEELLAIANVDRRVTMAGLTIFAALALVLALVGTYGLIAFVAATRRNEFGLRLALGATPRIVGWMVLREGAKLAVFGVAAGFAGALMLARLLVTLLYAVPPTDPLTYAASAALLLLLVLGASLVPARRAGAVPPASVLRGD